MVLVSWVDLRNATLKPGVTEREVTLEADGIRAEFVHRETELALYPDVTDEPDPSLSEEQTHLFVAKRWLRQYLGERGLGFDLNPGNGTSNLEEACNGSLF